MPVGILLLAVLMTISPAAPQQDSGVSSTGVTTAQPRSSSDAQAPAAELPVSLDRIRDGLSSTTPIQESLLKQPTFRVEVQEQHHLSEVLAHVDLKSGPTPAAGIYGYETQRVMANSINQPLLQPYAAFSGGELLTLALEGLITKYLGAKLVDGITSAERLRAEAAARAEVSREITQYCAGLPNGGAGVRLCSAPLAP